MWKKWMLDVTHWPQTCYCPVDENGNIVTGFNLVQKEPPGELVGIFHEDGQEAADAFWAAHEVEILALSAKPVQP